ncbi:MAG: flagellar basal body P-ring formation protein FlgA [Rhodospirillaceae bacterium]|nr:flagellar basal body P-ring formation protein FlgA [Rhodospirillaceae bacterium]
MKRFLFILFVVLLFAPTASLAATGSGPSTLNSHVMVSGDVVLLGDIFTNAGEKSDQAVAYSPSAGQKAVFDAPWLGRVAKAFGINWAPISGLERAVIERNSEVIEADEIKAVLAQRLIEDGIDPSSEITLSNKSMRIYAPIGLGGELRVEDISHDRLSGRFSAKLLWQGENGSQKVRVSGRVDRVSEIPVLSRRILRGDNITKRDISWIKVRSTSLQRDTVIDHADLIGMTAKRTIAASQPVRTSEIRRPLMVEKGSSVTIRLATPMMQLTTKGRALEQGSHGDIIRISNLQTKTVIEAEITGPGTARVSSSVNLAMK